MEALLALFLSALLAIACGQTNSGLTIRILSTVNKEKLDTTLSSVYANMLFRSLCRAPGNKAIVRFNPVDGTADVMDESQGLDNETLRVTSCMFEEMDSHVTCSDTPHFCQLNNDCIAEIKSSCSPHNLRTMHYVDVTVSTVDMHLVVEDCMVLCEEEGYREVDPYRGGNGISDWAVGLIIAGVILGASLLVVGAVIWKIRDSKIVRENHHKNHHINYVR
ncbi:hypothetical protein BgiMline_026618 [Biomphalaria glabrata]|nr:hypothetical protein BgiMline_021082 [Biomphalaria glabrata]